MAVADVTTTNDVSVSRATYRPTTKRPAVALFQNESPFLLIFILLGIMSLIIITMIALTLTS